MADASTQLTTLPNRIGRAAGLVCVVLAGAACTLQTPFQARGHLDYDPALVTGERLFDAPVAPAATGDARVYEPSDAMREFVGTVTADARHSNARFRSLMAGLHGAGYLDAVYSANSTLTAAETFESKGGNCLSYTNMFVALAREAGLNARYQVVDVPASWDADSGFLIRYTHINVVVQGVRLDRLSRQSVIVDFNAVHPEGDFSQRIVSDAYAESLYYAKKSVNLLRADRPRQGFAYLRRALEIAPENADLWVNLGAFYATLEDYESSIEAYEVARQIDPSNKSAVAGMARSHANAGNTEMAAVYDRKVRNYRKRNPYYHYALAQSAFEKADFEQSLTAIDQAIDLKRRIPRFYLFKGLVEQRLGRTDAAEESFRRAQRYGLDRRVKLDVINSVASWTPVTAS